VSIPNLSSKIIFLKHIPIGTLCPEKRTILPVACILIHVSGYRIQDCGMVQAWRVQGVAAQVCEGRCVRLYSVERNKRITQQNKTKTK
jgi:hypothetical protein